MKLKEVRAKNFLTYEELQYNFVDKPLMIQGLNLTDDKQKSNGSGKSSIQAMIEFCITGDNSRGVRDIELIRFGCKESLLDLFVTCNTRKEEIHISWKIKSKGSNVLNIHKTKDGKNWEEVVFSNVNDGKKWILKWFAISKEDLFNYFIINKTRFKSFFKSSNKEKVELINRFSDASVIDGIEDIDTEELDKEYNELNENILRTEGKIEAQVENLQKEKDRDLETEYKEKVAEINEDNEDIDEEISEIKNDISEKEELISEQNDSIKKYKEDNLLQKGKKEELELKIEDKKKEFHNINKELEIAQEAVDNFEGTNWDDKKKVHKDNITGIKEDIKTKESDLKKVELNEEQVLKILNDLSIKLSGTITCPSCSHEFLTSGDLTLDELKDKQAKAETLKGSIQKKLQEKDSEITILKSSIETQNGCIEGINELEEKEYESKKVFLDKVNEINGKVNIKNSELTKLKTELQEIIDTISENDVEITSIKNKISQYEQDIKGFNSEIENYGKEKEANNNLLKSLKKVDNDEEINSIRLSIKNLESEKKEFEKDFKELEDELYKINQWKNNFKQFKMHVANKSLETMEFHCNRYLKGMGSDLKAKFDGYKVLANGTVKDEITARVIRNDERTFSSFSGGEQGRLLFASILANRHMINNTHPYGGLHFLSIDEVFEGVDGVGLQSLVEEAKKLQTCIMIITHVTDETVTEDILRVVKRNGISKIE